jgi:hypothetical protein
MIMVPALKCGLRNIKWHKDENLFDAPPQYFLIKKAKSPITHYLSPITYHPSPMNS